MSDFMRWPEGHFGASATMDWAAWRLPPAARVDWGSKALRSERICLNLAPGPSRGVYLCTRVSGHTGRHAAITLWDGAVRKVWE